MHITFSQQTPTKQMTPRQALFIMPIFVIIGILLLVFWGIPTARNAAQSRTWPSTEGSITFSDVVANYDSQDGSVTYGAKVLYTYPVNGVTYTGSTVAFGDYASSDPAHAGSIVSRYPAGNAVRAYYDPENPAVSVLEPGAGFSSFVGIIGGIVALLIGVVGFVIALRKVRGQSVAAPERVERAA